MSKILFGFLLSLICVGVFSQENTGTRFFNNLCESKEDSGSLYINQDPGIEELVGMHIESNKRSQGINGFRIQLYLGSNDNAKREAAKIKGRLLSLFPEEKPYVKFEAPSWRVQVGDYRSKNEALDLIRKLKKEFPSCYLVPVDNIPLSSFK